MTWIRTIRARRTALGAPAIALVLALGTCGGDVAVESQHDGAKSTAGDAQLPLLELSVYAPWTTTYSGVRRVQALADPGDPSSLVAYRERVSADGGGRFAVEFLELLSFVPNPSTFALHQATRQGYLYRYRDFAVRDLDAFLERWSVTDLGATATVAGRACAALHVAPAFGSGSTFDVALDLETGLVLRAVERDAQGVEVARMEFESYDAAPDLAQVAWFTPSLGETPLDPSGALDGQAGFDVMVPAVLPDGYASWRAALVVEPDGDRWIKQVFTDGVKPLFFFHRESSPSGGGGVHAAGGGGKLVVGPVQAPRTGHEDRVSVYQMGAATVVQGVLRGREVVALGEVDDQALLDVLEFAVE